MKRDMWVPFTEDPMATVSARRAMVDMPSPLPVRTVTG